MGFGHWMMVHPWETIMHYAQAHLLTAGTWRQSRSGGSTEMPTGAALPIPAIGFRGSKKRLAGSIYGGGVPERDITRILALYGKGRRPLDRQIGARITLDRVNEVSAGVLGRTIIEFAQ